MTSKIKPWYVYIVECSDGSLYTGITNDLNKRINTHNKGKGAKYVRGKTPITLKVFFEVKNRSEGSKLEYKIKQMNRSDKLKIISGEKLIN